VNTKLVITAIALTSATIFSSSAYSQFPGRNGVIGYSHSDGPYYYEGKRVIRSIQPDGTGEKNLLMNYYTFTWITGWSPDGSRFVWQKVSDSGAREIWISNADGSNSKKLTNYSCTMADASFSPDGKKIIYTDCTSGNAHIY
jgi:hypothetical protein